MLGFLRRILPGSGRRKGRGKVSAVLASDDLGRIEEEIEKAGHGRQVSRLCNRAGDLYLVKGDRANALKRYGEAIDAYLQAGEYDSAMAVCRKIIRVVPEVIRTRRTLAWLCLGKGFLEIAREHIDAYTSASIEAGLEPLAVQHLQMMAQYVGRSDFREFLARKLVELGDEKAASRALEGRPDGGLCSAGWTPVVFAAMLTPEELRRAVDKGVEIRAPTEEAGADDFDSLLFDPETGSARVRSASGEDEAPDREGTPDTGR